MGYLPHSSINHWVGEFSVSALFEDLENHAHCLITSVYGPSLNQRRAVYWREMLSEIDGMGLGALEEISTSFGFWRRNLVAVAFLKK